MAYPSGPLFGTPDPRLQTPSYEDLPVSNKQTVAGNPSIIDRYFAGQPAPSNGYADLASILGSFSSGEKANRLSQGSATGDYDKMMAALEATRNLAGNNANTDYNSAMQAAQTGRNQNENDAWRKLGQTEYVLGGGSNFKMPTLSYGGQSTTPPSFGLAPARSTAKEMEGAKTLQDTIMSRFGEEGSYQPARFTPEQSFQPHPFEDYGATPGTLEKLGSYGGAIVGGIGAIDKIMGGGNDAMDGQGGGIIGKLGGLGSFAGKIGSLFGNGPSAAGEVAGIDSKIAGMSGNAGSLGGNFLGKALPIAGAAYGGYQLLKGGSTGHNIASGAGTGASIGTLIMPGLGTGIGAGIGALVGGLRNGFHGSKTETEGRQSGAQAVQQISAGATPQQMQEAQGAGWGDKTPDALASIVMRDRLLAAGKDPNSAGMYLNLIKQAEKAGPQAVQSVIQKIMGEFAGGQPTNGMAAPRPSAPGLTPGGPGTYRG